MRTLVQLLALVACAGCATAGHPRPTPAPSGPAPTAATPVPAAQPPAPPPVVVPEPKIALVLGGGAARGFAHIGVIRVLEQERIPVDLVVGTSVGSLIGAVYASERDSFDLEWTAFQLTQDDIFDFRLMNTVLGMGYAKGEKIEAWLSEKIKQKNIEQLKVPFAAVATDLNWGHKVVLDRGSVAKAVHASSAIPGVFEPVSHVGKLLVDGGVVDNIPIDVARDKGADLVLAVDISEDVGNTNIKNVLDVCSRPPTSCSPRTWPTCAAAPTCSSPPRSARWACSTSPRRSCACRPAWRRPGPPFRDPGRHRGLEAEEGRLDGAAHVGLPPRGTRGRFRVGRVRSCDGTVGWAEGQARSGDHHRA